jgi:starch-binding outer membrane protein, SusD/RagB family
MKKSILSVITIILILVSGNSCSKDYLEVINKNQLALSSFYSTPNDAWKALNTCYNPLAFGGMFGNVYLLMIGSFDDRILFESAGMDDFSINSSTDNVRAIYQAMYVGLWRCSSVIHELKTREIPDFTEELRDNYIAQAKTLRAAYYFYLVVFFNSPYFYNDENLPEDYLASFPNSDPVLFWDQIEKDLTEAIPDLPEANELQPEDLGRMTKGAARAMLGKAMLFKHYHYYVKNSNSGSVEDIADLQLAKSSFADIFSSGTYSLITPMEPKSRKDYIYSFLCNFSYLPLPAGNNLYPAENNSESIWEIQYCDERIAPGWLPGWQWTGALNAQYLSTHVSSFKNEEVHPALYYQFETEGVPAGFDRDPRVYGTLYLDGDTMDFRPENTNYYAPYVSGSNNKRIAQSRGLTIEGQPSVGFGLKKYYFPTYNDKDAPKNDPVNIRVIRYSDVKLMYAEVTMLLNEDVSLGLDQLNEVRARVDMPPVPELTRTAIMHERDVELALEGHRFLDLVRWSFDPAWNIKWYDLLGNSSFTVGKNEYLPIPLEEINKNHGQLKQNPGW